MSKDAGFLRREVINEDCTRFLQRLHAALPSINRPVLPAQTFDTMPLAPKRRSGFCHRPVLRLVC
jgi:hypothetical protein